MTNKRPIDVEPGSDADTTPVPPMGETPPDPNHKQKPAPVETGDSGQDDDNIDDQGNKAGGGRQDQPT
ncbi:hypothetical protein [Devosia sp. Leaf64]|jgi:hypothetical protein|uniref:hypothetical protein n=1 Tax=Devosia sp. Leaf64 TaxID=1736229 RepID=UPI000AA850A0|nr:hypothetical protein [Devosia sp. Leaf64]